MTSTCRMQILSNIRGIVDIYHIDTEFGAG